MRVQIRTFTTFWAVLFIAGRLLAQGSASLQFEHLTHDFGSISEADGIVTHSFVFRNTGHQPVAILAAATTCGCTVTSFSRKPVMPSETSAVEVSFDPAERPGHFDKKITVTTSEGGEPYRLND